MSKIESAFGEFQIVPSTIGIDSGSVLLHAVAGSIAYGTSNDQSDVDTRGVFAQPLHDFIGLETPPALMADQRHNHVFYSLRRTIELLAEANPNIMELLYLPNDCLIHCAPEFSLVLEHRSMFMSRQCADTHVGYAYSQIKKAKGQNKWVNQPQPEQAPRREDYCYIIKTTEDQGKPPARPLRLADSGVVLVECHAAKVEHSANLFRLYHIGKEAKGVFRSDALVLESISLQEEANRFVGLMLFNEQAYQQAKADHSNYWTWRRERNESRWQQMESGDLDFDAKNLMHTIRLLLSGKSILSNGEPIVRFSGDDLQMLLKIRSGKMPYAEIMQLADDLKADCIALRDQSELPESCDRRSANALLLRMTRMWEERCRLTQ